MNKNFVKLFLTTCSFFIIPCISSAGIVGAIAGGVVGHAVGGHTGAVVGSIAGQSIGRNKQIESHCITNPALYVLNRHEEFCSKGIEFLCYGECDTYRKRKDGGVVFATERQEVCFVCYR